MFTGKLKIAAFDFNVVSWHNRAADASGCFGECSTSEQLIRIADNLSPTRLRDILLHEILHAIWWAYRLADEDKEERTVTTLATGLAQVLRDNPKLREFLSEKW